MNKQDNKNLILALVLSGLVMIGWTYFFGAPQLMTDLNKAQQQAQPAAAVPGAPTTPGQTGVAGQPATIAAGAVAVSRAAALEQSKRIPIETGKLIGSIALTGGRIDDITLRTYFEHPKQQGGNIVLLSPESAPNAYFADFGWIGTTGNAPTHQTVWTAEASAKLTATTPVILTFDNGAGLVFKREISVDDTYMFTVKDTVANKTAAPVSLTPYGFVARFGTPVVLGYYILHEGLIGVTGEAPQVATYKHQDEALTTSFDKASGGWVGMTDKYWAATVIPDQAKPFTGTFTSEAGPRQVYRALATSDVLTIAPSATGESTMRLFAGAKEVRTINAYGEKLGITKFDQLIDWGIFYFLTKPLFWLMDWLYHLVGNFGVTILLVTMVVKAIFFPLANKSYASMAKMKGAQPAMKAIQERLKDDKTAQQKELMELYKREKINPVAGCLPVLIQIPVFFALYKVLFITIEMRHAPFFGWVQDLSAPDPSNIFTLFGLLPFTLPAIIHLGVWPLIMGITMWLQMKMNPEPTDPTQKLIFSWMPLIFTFMLGSFPVGLVIYWAWNNFLSISQQYVIMKRYNVKIELWDNLRGLFKKKPAVTG